MSVFGVPFDENVSTFPASAVFANCMVALQFHESLKTVEYAEATFGSLKMTTWFEFT